MERSTIYKTGAALAAGGALAALAYHTVTSTYTRKTFLRPSHEVGIEKDLDHEQTPEYDFVIIGGGTASLVLANRLSASGEHSVLVLEAGQSGVALQESSIPARFYHLYRSVHDWSYRTTPQPSLNNRELSWPGTKLLGGCSSGNGMMFHLGAPEDYDEWGRIQGDHEGGRDWDYKGMKKYMQRFETFTPHPKVHTDAIERGKNGPIQTGYFTAFTTLGGAFLEACNSIGIKKSDDVNTSKGTLGATRTATYVTSKGQRCSTEQAYLTPEVLARPQLTVTTGAHVTKIRFDCSTETPHATGVEFAETKSGPVFFVKAKKEVLLTAGALNSPQILMLSGVGDAKQLKEHGVDVVKDLPTVGKHLTNHFGVNLRFGTKPGLSSRHMLAPKTFAQQVTLITIVLKHKLFGSGYLSMAPDAIAFVRVGDGPLASDVLARPDMAKALGEADSTSAKTAPDVELMMSSFTGHDQLDGRAMSIAAMILRPSSLGEVSLYSKDPWEKPKIDSRYMSTRRDMETMVRGIRLASKIAHQEPLASLLNLGDTSNPLLDHGIDALSDEEIQEIVKARGETSCHQASTARMAPLTDGGVVDTSLRVYGVDGLRVVDASVMPKVVSGHTAGPVITIAEKAADLILQSWKTG